MNQKIDKKTSKIIFYLLVGFCLFLGLNFHSLPNFILIIAWGSVFSAMVIGMFFGLKFKQIAVFGLFIGAISLIFSMLISMKNIEIPSLKYGNIIGVILLILFLALLSFITGLMLGFSAKPLVDLVRLNFTKLPKNKHLPKWIYIFLRDEEKEDHLIYYRTKCYEKNANNKLIKLKVLVKTLHYLFIEVKLKEFIDRVIFSTLKIPRR